jgi:hypothetical protein
MAIAVIIGMNRTDPAILRVGIKNTILVKFPCSVEPDNGYFKIKVTKNRLSSLIEKEMHGTVLYQNKEIEGRILSIIGKNGVLEISFQPKMKEGK